MDIHSHNNMNAFFSRTDDRDEKAARVYAVVGRISSFFPEIKVRIANSRSFVEIDPWNALFQSSCLAQAAQAVTPRRIFTG